MYVLAYRHTGVHLSFKGMTYSNNSIFFINEIGRTSSNSAIQCVTDKQECCFSPANRFGEWYFPNGTQLPIEHHPIDGFATHFYRNRGNDGTVSLNRVSSSVVSPTGRFCCELPDSTHEQQSLCAFIGKYACSALWVLVLSMFNVMHAHSIMTLPYIIMLQ